ncbi:MAG: C69 family dipeptidase [Dysgonamonadaceae bacterium]|nr:C69 family dipeptidase [Dysgonamonadaceae bacterium]
MKKYFLFACIFFCLQVYPCTNFLVGKGASIDGSTMVTYSADSYSLYGELYFWPGSRHDSGMMLDVREWDTGKYLGRIAQETETFNVVGNMNEHQLCIGETTWGGRSELSDSTGLIDYGSLIYITLQRAKTAREAIKIMTDLVKEYGYYSSGESFSIVDKDEVWIMDMIGKGSGSRGAVWVAVRIPDDCISAHANQARIHLFPLHDPENCVYSEDVISFAREKGYFEGRDEDFSFAGAYNPVEWSGLRFCEARVWSFFNRWSDGADRWLPYIFGNDTEPMPLYIRPKRKLGVRDLMSSMRDHYEGTPFDPSNDVAAGPFHSPYRLSPITWGVDGERYIFERPVSTQQTAFTFVSQMRSFLPDIVGGVLWFGVDDACFTVYNPIYPCLSRVPECYRVGNGDFEHFSWTSSFWIHNWVANMAYSRYDQVLPYAVALQDRLEGGYLENQATIEGEALELCLTDRDRAVNFLTEYSISSAQTAIDEWKRFGEYLVVKFMDGAVKREVDGRFERNEHGGSQYPDRPTFDDDFLRRIVREKGDWLRDGGPAFDKD